MIDKSTRQHYAMQGKVKNYLGKQKMVKAPKYWLSKPGHIKAKLAYITDEEEQILIDKNLYGSLKGRPNVGPAGLPSLQGGDFGGSGGGAGGGAGEGQDRHPSTYSAPTRSRQESVAREEKAKVDTQREEQANIDLTFYRDPIRDLADKQKKKDKEMLQQRMNIANQFQIPLDYSATDLQARAKRAMTQPGVQFELEPYDPNIPEELQGLYGQKYTGTRYDPYKVSPPTETISKNPIGGLDQFAKEVGFLEDKYSPGTRLGLGDLPGTLQDYYRNKVGMDPQTKFQVTAPTADTDLASTISKNPKGVHIGEGIATIPGSIQGVISKPAFDESSWDFQDNKTKYVQDIQEKADIEWENKSQYEKEEQQQKWDTAEAKLKADKKGGFWKTLGNIALGILLPQLLPAKLAAAYKVGNMAKTALTMANKIGLTESDIMQQFKGMDLTSLISGDQNVIAKFMDKFTGGDKRKARTALRKETELQKEIRDYNLKSAQGIAQLESDEFSDIKGQRAGLKDMSTLQKVEFNKLDMINKMEKSGVWTGEPLTNEEKEKLEKLRKLRESKVSGSTGTAIAAHGGFIDRPLMGRSRDI